MKALKTVLQFISCRPLIVPALLVLTVDLFYVNSEMRKDYAVNQSGQHTYISGTVRDKAFDENGNLKSITVGDTICYVNKGDIQIGSFVKLSGKVYPMESAMNRGGFDHKKYYASKRIRYRFNVDKVIKVTPGRFSFRELFYKERNKLSGLLNSNCPYEAGTINTLLLGDKSNLSEDRKELFKDVGISHFLVISGLHISIIGSLIFKGLKKFGIKRSVSCFLSMLIIFNYGLLVGFSISVIRAVTMYFLRLLSYILKRSYDMLSAIFASVIVNILINPFCVLNSAFVYSYATVLTIGFYMEVYATDIKQRSIKEKLIENFRFSAVLFLFMLPISLKVSHYYSLAAVFVNIMLAPLSLPIIVLSGLSLISASLGFSFGAKLFSGILAVVLRILDLICEAFSSSNCFAFFGNPSLVIVLAYLACMFLLIFICQENIPKAIKSVTILSLMTLLSIPRLNNPSISMLYVGQGECIVIKTGAGSAIMMDCGSSSDEKFLEDDVLPFLKEEGITTLSGIFVSHADKDHICGVPELIESKSHIKIKHIYLPKIRDKDKNNYYKKTVSLAKDKGIPVTYVERKDAFKFGKLKLLCIAPSYKNLSGDANKDSLIMLLKMPKGVDVLLTGDSEISSQESVLPEILKFSDNRIEILKVAHHGSKNSTSQKIVESENPKLAIISAGKHNSYGHPHKEVTEILRNNKTGFACTKDDGEIDIFLHGRKFFARSFCH